MTIDGLYEEHEESLQRQALRLTRDTGAAEDLVQETFVRALGHRLLLAQLNRHQRLAWLRQTLKRLFLDRRGGAGSGMPPCWRSTGARSPRR